MQQTCANAWCGQPFEITEQDLEFYDKISPVFDGKKYTIPPPEKCPQCRFKERLQWRPELHLFKRKSDRSGNIILSFLPQEAPCTVYSVEEWWNDDWNPLDYGRDYDPSRSFFDQFQELLSKVPIVSLSIGGENINSDYLNSASWLKNCYLLAGANYDEDCCYGNFVNHCKSCMDCSFIDHCELCYECIDCTRCYDLNASQECSNCSESSFLFACRNCKNCFGCVNLVDKQYMFLNEQCSREEYEQKVAATELHRRSRWKEAEHFFHDHRLKYPHKYMIGEMNENVTGNGIIHSKNVFDSFDVSESEDCRYCAWFHRAKDCQDCYAWGFTAQECYSCLEVGLDSSRVHFSLLSYTDNDLLYCFNCRSSSNLFGCISMKRGSYCILNKQYTQEEYTKLVPVIIEKMKKDGEWGNFFPSRVCPMAYNQSIANDYFPMTKAEALARGARWSDEIEAVAPQETTPVPDSLADAPKNICEQTLMCPETGKPWKIIPQELSFYQQKNLPLPDVSFFARHMRRLRRRNPRKLWKRECANCRKSLATSYAPDRPEITYCEECYLKEVY